MLVSEKIMQSKEKEVEFNGGLTEMGRFKKGESGNKSTQFSSERQPAKNGRPKKLVNAIKSLPPHMQEDIHGILGYALTLKSEAEAKAYLEEQTGRLGHYGFLMQIAIRQLCNKNYGWGAAMDILDRLYGKPRQSAEVRHTGESMTIVVQSKEEADMIEGMKELEI